jgi:hypothetical protein
MRQGSGRNRAWTDSRSALLFALLGAACADPEAGLGPRGGGGVTPPVGSAGTGATSGTGGGGFVPTSGRSGGAAGGAMPCDADADRNASAGNGCNGPGLAGTGAGGSGAATGGGGSGPGNPQGNSRPTTYSDDTWPAPAAEETCYELLTHGGTTPADTTPYMVVPFEHYEQFYYTVPWTSPVNATRIGSRLDNRAVLHHWLLFTSAYPTDLAGTHVTTPGTQLADDAALIAGWAVGGEHFVMPPDVEIELPLPNTLLNVQWHYYNSTGMDQPDSSAILICTVPPGTREHTGSITWLGTEDLGGIVGMHPGFKGEYSGTCPNDSPGPITIFFFWPHMHEIGKRLRSVVNRASGAQEEVFNMAFDFNYQVHYPANVVLQPGDSITSFCEFDNTTDFNIPFGPSTNQEMCYQFAFSYPAGALDNGVISLIGARNTCW